MTTEQEREALALAGKFVINKVTGAKGRVWQACGETLLVRGTDNLGYTWLTADTELLAKKAGGPKNG